MAYPSALFTGAGDKGAATRPSLTELGDLRALNVVRRVKSGSPRGVTLKTAASPRSRKRRRVVLCECQFRSNRSAFMTLFQAETKSLTNFSFESEQAYTSAMARS